MRTSLTRLVAAALLATSASNAMAATDAGPKAIVDGIANTAITGGHCDGLAIGIDQAGTENEYFYGKSGTARAIDGKTVFEIASVTKTFAALILALATQRADKPMRLDDPLQKYAPPGVTLPSLNGTPIRLVDLATHTAGLPRQDTDTSAPQPPKQVWAFTAGLTLNSEPGTKFLYSNLGFGLLSDAEERDQKQGFGQLLKAQITGPLGMSDTVITVSPDQQARKAQGHRANERRTLPHRRSSHARCLLARAMSCQCAPKLNSGSSLPRSAKIQICLRLPRVTSPGWPSSSTRSTGSMKTVPFLTKTLVFDDRFCASLASSSTAGRFARSNREKR